jgi:hypothetical protein
MGKRATTGNCEGTETSVVLRDRRMRTERRIRIAWKAYLAEAGVMQALERPSETAEWVRKYFRRRLEEAVAVLPGDSSALAEVLSEMLALLMGEEEIGDR